MPGCASTVTKNAHGGFVVAFQFCSFNFSSVSRSSSPAGTPPLSAAAHFRADRASLIADTDPAGGGQILVLPELRDKHLVAARVRPDVNGSLVLRYESNVTDTDWFTEVNAAQSWEANSLGAPLVTMQDHQILATTLRLPYPLVRVAGTALAANDVPLTRATVDVFYTTTFASTRWSPLRVGWFADDTQPNPVAAALTELQRLQQLQRNAILGLGAGGAQIVALTCQLATPGADRILYIRPGDVGNASYQIPNLVANNAPGNYKFFPSVFIRRLEYARTINFSDDLSGTAITTVSGSLPVFVVTAAPLYSRWVFILDGCPIEVVLPHPAGSDYRTGLEIWNNLIAPAFQPGNASILGRLGTIAITSQEYLDAAIFIEPLGDGLSPITELLVQT